MMNERDNIPLRNNVQGLSGEKEDPQLKSVADLDMLELMPSIGKRSCSSDHLKESSKNNTTEDLAELMNRQYKAVGAQLPSRNVLNDVNRGRDNQMNEIGRFMNINLPLDTTKRGSDDKEESNLNDIEEQKDQVDMLSSRSSEDSEGADHTYNPYSFKRL